MAVTVGIDIGTTSVKAVAVDDDGNVLRRTRVPHDVHFPTPTRFEHDAMEAWCTGPRKAWADVQGDDVEAVAVSAMVPSLCAVDDDGCPLTPGLLYGDERGDVADPSLPTGLAGEGTGFLRWSAIKAPDAHGFWPAQAVANFALSGVAAMDQTAAAALYPVFDGTTWVGEEFGATPEMFPEVAPLGASIGRVGAEGPVLAGGTVDALGEQLVAGETQPGDVLIMCGTTLLVWVVIDEYRTVDGLWTIPHVIPGQFLIGGPSNAGGLFLTWARDLVVDSRGHVDAGEVPVWQPYPRGERVPLHDPARRASLHDLDIVQHPQAVLRAAYEASGFVARRIIEASGVAPGRLLAVGGGTKVETWMQALADATGIDVLPAANPEGGALGAAWVARMAAGLETELAAATRWGRHGDPVEPDPVWSAAMESRYARFLELTEG